MLTRRKIRQEIETLDWSGHVELGAADMDWLASQLYVRLTESREEVCDACNKPAPVVLQTALGSICAECIDDMAEDIDQIKDTMAH